LNLVPLKKKTLIQYFAPYPEMITITGTRETIRAGNFRNGTINRTSKQVPDLKVMKQVPDLKVMVEGTLRRPLEMGEWELVPENFVPLYKIMVARGISMMLSSSSMAFLWITI